jgi:hypothetical protein
VSYPPFLSTIIFAAKICHNCELVEKRQNVIAEKFDIFVREHGVHAGPKDYFVVVVVVVVICGSI